MYAVIECLGRQYKVAVGDVIKIDSVAKNASVGKHLIFKNVLMVGSENDEPKVGKPYLSGASVKAELVEEGKDKKIVSYKKKRRKGYERKIGFRRPYTAVKIQDISAAA